MQSRVLSWDQVPRASDSSLWGILALPLCALRCTGWLRLVLICVLSPSPLKSSGFPRALFLPSPAFLHPSTRLLFTFTKDLFLSPGKSGSSALPTPQVQERAPFRVITVQVGSGERPVGSAGPGPCPKYDSENPRCGQWGVGGLVRRWGRKPAPGKPFQKEGWVADVSVERYVSHLLLPNFELRR